MRVFSLNTVALALVVFSLTVPTGAVLGDHVGGPEGVVLSPHSGPNGKYASFDGKGNLSIDLGDDLSGDAVTTYDGVFDVTNNASHYAQVWITHNATGYVEFWTSGSGSIQGVGNGTILAPGETVAVGVTVDTHGASPGTRLIQAMGVHARKVQPPSTPTSSGGSSSSDSGGTAPPTGTPSREPSGTLVGSGRVRIQFDREVGPDEDVRIERLGGLPPDPAGGDLTARASRKNGSSGNATSLPASEERLDDLDLDTAARPDETFVLTGTGSRFPTAASIDSSRRTAVVYDIEPPPRLADVGATVWVTVNRSRFGDSAPSGALLGRRTGTGWQLLGSRTTGVNATHVEVRSRTPGFSTFALFSAPEVEFQWSFPGKGTTSGMAVPLSYADPGIYEGTLTVSDADGRTDDVPYRVLVNDRPRVRIVRPESIDSGERVTLRADVDDDFGATSVRWTFDDGTVAEGTAVTRSFDRGEHTVTVRAVDEFGAAGRTRTEFVAGDRDPLVQLVEFTLGFEGRLALTALLSLAVIAALKWVDGRRGGARTRRTIR